MSRKPLAMKQLITEITAAFDDVTESSFKPDHVDGLGTFRTLLVDLGDVDSASDLQFLLDRDDRVSATYIDFTEDGSDLDGFDIAIEFVSSIAADAKHSFGLAEFLATAHEAVASADDIDDDDLPVVGKDFGQQLYTEDDLKGKRVASLEKLVTGADTTVRGVGGAWNRDELVHYLTTGEGPDYDTTPDPDVVDDEPDAE